MSFFDKSFVSSYLEKVYKGEFEIDKGKKYLGYENEVLFMENFLSNLHYPGRFKSKNFNLAICIIPERMVGVKVSDLNNNIVSNKTVKVKINENLVGEGELNINGVCILPSKEKEFIYNLNPVTFMAEIAITISVDKDIMTIPYNQIAIPDFLLKLINGEWKKSKYGLLLMPIVDMVNNKIIGYEALFKKKNQDDNNVIETFRVFDLIYSLGPTVAKAFDKSVYTHVIDILNSKEIFKLLSHDCQYISVNFYPKSFVNMDKTLEKAPDENNILIQVELLEKTHGDTNSKNVLEGIEKILRNKNCKHIIWAIDDFGDNDNAEISRVKDIIMTIEKESDSKEKVKLKADMSLTKMVYENNSDLIQMLKPLKKNRIVIFEGIKDKSYEEKIKNAGFRFGQGYYYNDYNIETWKHL